MSWLSRWLQKPKKVPQNAPAPRRRLSYQCAALTAIGTRDRQEDDLTLVNANDVTLLQKEGLLAVVADGMGGLENGALASRIGIRTLTEDFQSMDRTQPLEPQLAQSVIRASELVYAQLQGKGGSTIIACLLFEEQLHYAGLGDSYLYLFRGGKLIRINREQNILHRHYLEQIRRGSMELSGLSGLSQPQAVTGFLGLDQPAEPDQLRRALPLQDGDVLLLCSDGVGGVLLPAELCECLRLPDADAAAAALQQKVRSQELRNQDNYTAIVIYCKK